MGLDFSEDRERERQDELRLFPTRQSKTGREVSVPLGVRVSGLQVLASFTSELCSQHHLDPL